MDSLLPGEVSHCNRVTLPSNNMGSSKNLLLEPNSTFGRRVSSFRKITDAMEERKPSDHSIRSRLAPPKKRRLNSLEQSLDSLNSHKHESKSNAGLRLGAQLN